VLGRVTFTLSYSYNQVSLDSRIEKLRASTLIDTNAVRDVKQRGAEIMTAKQMGEVANGIKREIESKVILGFGKIDSESLPIEKLVSLFSIGKTWEMTEKQLEDLDARARAGMDLGVNAKDFQPFKYQRKVVDTLASDKDIKQHKKLYADFYKNEKEKLQVSASARGGGGFWSAKGSVNYSKEKEHTVSEGSLSDDEFKEHLQAYHGLEYTDQMVLERGVELCDVQKIRSAGEMEIVSVTIKPTMGAGVRSWTTRPFQQDAPRRRSMPRIDSSRSYVLSSGGADPGGQLEVPEAKHGGLRQKKVKADLGKNVMAVWWSPKGNFGDMRKFGSIVVDHDGDDLVFTADSTGEPALFEIRVFVAYAE
jgi:hypothetical protein